MEQLYVHSASLLNAVIGASWLSMLRLVLIGALLPVEPELDEPRPTSTTISALPVALVLSATVAEQYQGALERLAGRRAQLATLPQTDRVAAAREVLLAVFDEALFPAWEGTPWDFYGTSETPREGKIACGYYVTTLLRDAGFHLERVKLAQLASEHLVKTLAAEGEILRLRGASPAEVVKQVRQRYGPGLYVVGMDFHVGLLRLTADGAKLCHAAFLGAARTTCENAEDSPGLASGSHVVGPVLSDARVADWLAGREIPLR
jgi:hypothetical protein